MITFLITYAQNYMKEKKSILYLGKNSMVIYVIHTFFTAFSRIILNKMNVDNFIIQTVIGTLIGIGMPLLCYYIINKVRFLRWCKFFFYPSIKRRKND